MYLIINMYFNNIYNLELRNEKLEKIYIKSSNKDLEYKVGDYVKVSKISGKYTIEEKVETPVNFLDFYNKGSKSYQELYDCFKLYYDKIQKEEYKIILDETIFKNLDFFKYPAAKTIHHAYIGGLAEHTLSMLELSESFINLYDLDREMLWMGIILHDFSKVKELEAYGLTYSVEGNLIGHLVMTIEIISNIMFKYSIENDIDLITLKHLILSHHGRLEYGAAKEPMTKEALVLSTLDEIDAKMNLLNNALNLTPINCISNSINGFDKRRFLNYKKEEN